MIKPKIETKHVLLSITESCETLIKQTHRKAEETLKFEMIKPRESFHFNPTISIEGSWMLRLTSLEVYNSTYNITKNKKLELYKFIDSKIGGISYENVKNEIEKESENTDNTAADLQDDIIGLNIIEQYRENREKVTERMKIDKYMDILAVYNRSIFQDFQSFLEGEVDLVGDDIRLVLNEYNSSFITYELEPGIYTFNDFSETILKILQPEYPGYHNAINIEFDDITIKTKLVVRPGFIALKFDANSSFSVILGFTFHWDYKNYNE